MFFNSAAYVWAWMVMIFLCVAGSDVNSPHLHSGKLTPFDGNRINLSLNIEEERKLAAEGVLIRKTVSGNGGRGIVVQDVNASTSACMRAIKSVDAYKGLVPHIIAVEVYGSDVEADGTEHIRAKMKAGMLGFNLEYFLHLIYRPALNTLTWTLDYSKRSDIDDSVGHWQVESHPNKTGWARVFYSTELALPKFIPSMVISYLTKNVLGESTQWVKMEAERHTAEENKKCAPLVVPAGGMGGQGDSGGSGGGNSPLMRPGAKKLEARETYAVEKASEKEQILYKFPRFGFLARTKKILFGATTQVVINPPRTSPSTTSQQQENNDRS